MEILLFSLSDEKFCIPLTFVESIEHIAQITVVPKSKKYVVGLVNIRGKIIPVIDMAKLLNLDKKVQMNKFILVNSEKQSMAIIADDVDDVINIEEKDVESIAVGLEEVSLVKYQKIVATLISEYELNKI